MTQQHRATAQFQTDREEVVQSVSIGSNEPLRSDEVIRMFDTLRGRVDGLRDRELRARAAQKISDMQSEIRANRHGLIGNGHGRNTKQKTFDHDGKQYRIDFVLSGEMKG